MTYLELFCSTVIHLLLVFHFIIINNFRFNCTLRCCSAVLTIFTLSFSNFKYSVSFKLLRIVFFFIRIFNSRELLIYFWFLSYVWFRINLWTFVLYRYHFLTAFCFVTIFYKRVLREFVACSLTIFCFFIIW